MPLVKRLVTPVKLSCDKIDSQNEDCIFSAVNHNTLVNVLHQLASLVTHAGDIFNDINTITDQVVRRAYDIKLRLDELEIKACLYDPKLVPVPEGCLEKGAKPPEQTLKQELGKEFFKKVSRPRFLNVLYDKAGNHVPPFPIRSLRKDMSDDQLSYVERYKVEGERLESLSDSELLKKMEVEHTTKGDKVWPREPDYAFLPALPINVVQVDVTGKGFDRQKANRRSLVIHTKKIRHKKRRNTICGLMLSKECGIQTSFPSMDGHQIEAKSDGYRSSSTSSTQCTAMKLCDSKASSFDDDGIPKSPSITCQAAWLSDSDSVDTEGYFTSFRSECGLLKYRKNDVDVCVNEKDTQSSFDDEMQHCNGMSDKEDNSNSFDGSSETILDLLAAMDSLPQKQTQSDDNNEADLLKNSDCLADDGSDWKDRLTRKPSMDAMLPLTVVTPSPPSSIESPVSEALKSQFCSPRSVLGISENKSDESEDTGTVSSFRNQEKVLSAKDLTKPGSSSVEGPVLEDGSESKGEKLPQPDVIPNVQMEGLNPSTVNLTTKPLASTSTASPVTAKEAIVSDSRTESYVLEDSRLLSSQASFDQNKNIDKNVNVTKFTEKMPPNILTPCMEFDKCMKELNYNACDTLEGSNTMKSEERKGARVVLNAIGDIVFSTDKYKDSSHSPTNSHSSWIPKANERPQSLSYNKRLLRDEYATISEKNRNFNDNTGGGKYYDKRLEKNYPFLGLYGLHSLDRRNKTYQSGSSIKPDSTKHAIFDSKKSSMLNNVRSDNPSNGSPSRDVQNNVEHLLETDLDSAIPPVMPELKNLPAIKNRLQRNESYRIANDEIFNIPKSSQQITNEWCRPSNPKSRVNKNLITKSDSMTYT